MVFIGWYGHSYCGGELFPLFLLVVIGSVEFTHANPIASCVLHVIVAMSGTILSDVMLGRPFFGFVKNESVILTGVIVW